MTDSDELPSWALSRRSAGGWHVWDRDTDAHLGHVEPVAAPTAAQRAEWGAPRSRGGWLAYSAWGGPDATGTLQGDYRTRASAAEALHVQWMHYLQTAPVDQIRTAFLPEPDA